MLLKKYPKVDYKKLPKKLQESYNKREAEILNTNKIFNELFNKIPNIWKINDNKDKEKECEKMLNDIVYKINNYFDFTMTANLTRQERRSVTFIYQDYTMP
jgi:beta-mannanase